jgi:hypothetical protein
MIVNRNLVYMPPVAKRAVRYSVAAQEDRCAPRISLRIPASLRPAGASGFSVTIIDLSLAGFACEGVSGMVRGNRCWLSLHGLAGLQSEVVRNDGAIIGCAFDQLLHPSVLERILTLFVQR